MSEAAIQDSHQPRYSVWTWIFNPFEFIAGGQALAAGLIIIVISGVLAAVGNGRFDGVLDFHAGSEVVLWVPIAEGLINWLCMGLILFGLGSLWSQSNVRAIDVLGTQAFARYPYGILALLAMLPGVQAYTSATMAQLKRITEEGIQSPTALQDLAFPPGISAFEMAQFFFFTFMVIVLLVWMIILMYKAFSVSCNLRGAKAIGMFILGLLLAEILSKILILGMSYATGTLPDMPGLSG